MESKLQYAIRPCTPILGSVAYQTAHQVRKFSARTVGITCTECIDAIDVKEHLGPYIIKVSKKCGREIKSRPPGEHGIGMKIEAGDRVVVPASWLQIAANPLKGNGTLTRSGLEWYAREVFIGNLAGKKDDFSSVLKELDEQFGEALQKSKLLDGFDLSDPKHAEAIFERLKENKNSSEWLLYSSGGFLAIADQAIAEGKASLAAWATANFERFRSPYIFKEHFEEVVYMGHSARRLIELIKIWDANKTNSNEEFWQFQFETHSIALSQLFSGPVNFIRGKAYVGGQGILRRGGTW